MYNILAKKLIIGLVFATIISNSNPIANPSEKADNLALSAKEGVELRNAPSQNTVLAQSDALDQWIEQLVTKESNGKANIKIVDRNGYFSYGCLQFQMRTFREYVRKYNLLPEAEDEELKNMIYDCEFQKYLAKKMLEDNPDNWRHWHTSVVAKKLGLPPQP